MAKSLAQLKAEQEALAAQIAEAEAATKAEPKSVEERLAALEAVAFTPVQFAKIKEVFVQHHGMPDYEG